MDMANCLASPLQWKKGETIGLILNYAPSFQWLCWDAGRGQCGVAPFPSVMFPRASNTDPVAKRAFVDGIQCHSFKSVSE